MLQSGFKLLRLPAAFLALTLPLIFCGIRIFPTEASATRPDKEPPSQTLPVLKDPPAAAAADAARLTFHVSPLSAKGLLTQQTRDALQALLRANHGAPMVKLRAFVAGTGDARRVQAIVSEIFTDKKQPLPALSTIQVGALPLEGAQVVIESVSEEKKGGEETAEPQRSCVSRPRSMLTAPPAAVEQLAAAAKNANVAPSDMLRVTCFLGSRRRCRTRAPRRVSRISLGRRRFRPARLRLGAGPSADCEGVDRRTNGGMNAPRLIFTGAQMAFGTQDSDLHLAFERLEKTLNSAGRLAIAA